MIMIIKESLTLDTNNLLLNCFIYHENVKGDKYSWKTWGNNQYSLKGRTRNSGRGCKLKI